ncbi:MAG: hypothetical protein ACXWT3_03975 [Methylococcaceae bacterium]
MAQRQKILIFQAAICFRLSIVELKKHISASPRFIALFIDSNWFKVSVKASGCAAFFGGSITT